MTLTERIKIADRIMKAIDHIVKAAESETDRERMIDMTEAAQRLSDIHKSCMADFQHARIDKER